MGNTPSSSLHAVSSPRSIVDAAMENALSMEQLVDSFVGTHIPGNYADSKPFQFDILGYFRHLGLNWTREELFSIDSGRKGEAYTMIRFCINALSENFRKRSLGANWPYNSMFDNKEGLITVCYIKDGDIKPFGSSGAPYIGKNDYSYSNTTQQPSRKDLLKAILNPKGSPTLRHIDPHTRAHALGEITRDEAQRLVRGS